MKIALVQQTATADRALNARRGLETVRPSAAGGAALVCVAGSFSEAAARTSTPEGSRGSFGSGESTAPRAR